MRGRRLAVPMLCALLAACAGSKQYVDPVPSNESAQCLEQCQAIRFQCRKEALKEHKTCEGLYNYHYRQWRACVYERGERACASLKPFGCGGPRYAICTEHYDRCFVGCGGRIE